MTRPQTISDNTYLFIDKRIAKTTRDLISEKVAVMAKEDGDIFLYVSALHTCSLDYRSYSRFASQNREVLFLLMDTHSVVIHKYDFNQDLACICCLLYHIRANYDRLKLNRLERYYANHEYEFIFEPTYFDVIPGLAKMLLPGKLIHYNLKDLEITIEPAFFHPHCLCGRNKITPMNPMSLKRKVTSQNMRVNSQLDLSEYISVYSGVIRKQKMKVDSVGFATGITEMSYFKKERDPDYCCGKSPNKGASKLISECEAIERYHITNLALNDTFIYDSYENLKDQAVDPRELFFSRVQQDKNELSYSPELQMHWVWATNLSRQRLVLVPAREFWFFTDLLKNNTECIHTTSSGTAVGSCLEEALLYSILEVIERDSFLTSWYLRRKCNLIDPSSVKNEDFQILYERIMYAHPNYRIYFLDISNDTRVPSVWVLGVKQRGKGVKTMTAAASRITIEQAMYSGLKEVCGFFDFNPEFEKRKHEFMSIWKDISKARSIEHHIGVNGLNEAFVNFQFLDLDAKDLKDAREVRPMFREAKQYDLKALIDGLIGNLDEIGCEVLAKDLTNREFRKLVCVKSLVTNMYPMHFGYLQMRFEISPRLQKLSLLYNGRKLSKPEDINLSLHPFP